MIDLGSCKDQNGTIMLSMKASVRLCSL